MVARYEVYFLDARRPMTYLQAQAWEIAEVCIIESGFGCPAIGVQVTESVEVRLP
jgi:hypothetical protein